MRQLKLLGTQLTIRTNDKAGVDGAPVHYVIGGFDATNNPYAFSDDPPYEVSVTFESGPSTGKPNGVSNCTLLAIVFDRLARLEKINDEELDAYESIGNAIACLRRNEEDRRANEQR